MAQQLYFNQTALAAAAGKSIGFSILGTFDFPDGFMRLHAGPGTVYAGGHEWKGMGDLVSFGSIDAGFGDAAKVLPIKLSGISKEIQVLATGDMARIKGRKVQILYWFFDPATWQSYDDPVVVATYKMQRMSAEGDATNRSITLFCEGLLTGRSKPPAGLITHTDQKFRYPNDRGIERRSEVPQKRVAWPAG